MFSRVRAFLSRHRRKFIVGGVVIGGAVLLSRYAQRALRDWQERETKDFLERTRKRQHFESVERTCNQTALTLTPRLQETIAKLVDTDALIKELREGSSNKLTVWESLKLMAFTKLVLSVYLSSMLMLTLRLQLTLIGGYMFRDTMDDSRVRISSAMQEKYLSLCLHLLGDGAAALCQVIADNVRLVLQDRSLKEQLRLSEVEQLLWAVDTAVCSDPRNPLHKLPHFVLPPNAEAQFEQSPVFSTIVTETRDVLESDEVISLTKSCLSRGFAYVVDNITEFFVVQAPREPQPGTSSSPDAFFAANMAASEMVDVTHTRISLAKLIPIVSGLVSGTGGEDFTCKWMRQLILMDNLKVMGANLYESFSDNNNAS